jgi:hypothetical protein
MRKAKFTIVAGAIVALAAVLSVQGPVEAGTCQSVKAKGKGKNIAAATTLAQADLASKASALKGKVTQTSTNCVPGPTAVVCKISAVVCPKRK